MKKLLILTLLLWFSAAMFGQALIIQPQINLPKDSIISQNLILYLTDFLESTKPDNPRIAINNKAVTLDLIDEIIGIQKSKKYKDDYFYKPYLQNVIQISDTTYLIQLSYIGVDKETPIVRANIDLLGIVSDANEFTFSSPISIYTATWKKKETNGFTFHYKNKLNNSSVNNYIKTQLLFDNKLGNTNGKVEIYCCSNSVEVLKLLGVSYKLDYNGRNNLSLSYTYGDKTVNVSSNFGDEFNSFDPHDLFHERARKAVPRDKYNHYMVCGCAYVFGGSWGISWQDIKKKFKAEMLNKKNTDWLKLYNERYNFGESAAKHLLVTQFINALIIEKAETEKGFSTVKEFLSSGNFRKDRDNFFNELERITGISEKNFNKEVEKLIRNMK